eukprot:1339096-Amorphochlora_amoeboformis.AAC.1
MPIRLVMITIAIGPASPPKLTCTPDGPEGSVPLSYELNLHSVAAQSSYPSTDTYAIPINIIIKCTDISLFCRYAIIGDSAINS